MNVVLILVSISFLNFLSWTMLVESPKIIVPSNNQVWTDKTYKPSIKTVLIYQKGMELAFPIIKLVKDEKILLTFDEIGSTKGDYSWSLLHCNANWEQDELAPIEFLSGYGNGDITDVAFSQNTLINFTNYSLEIPQKDDEILKSGNYLVKVFERNKPEKLIITRRFYVYEPLAEVSTKVDQLKVNTTNGLNQRLNIEIKYNENEINNLSDFFTLKIFKNQGIEKTYTNLKPTNISGNKLKYENLSALCFAGGNEFRHFDIKSIKFLSDRLQNIEKIKDENRVTLTPDENRSLEDYNFKNDINGQKLIKLENNDRSNIMADYCQVHFQFKSEIPIEYGDYYIFGALTDWQFNEQNKMVYDYTLKKYTARLLVKQGYYNYHYLFKTEDKMFNTEEYLYKTEGNHFQTENEYQILVYYNDAVSGYERLIAYTSVNSSNSGKY